MPLTCPACSKTGQTEAACARCGCDLSRLHDIVEAAGWHLHAALDSFTDQDWAGALAHAEQSWRLRHTLESARVAFLAAAAGGDAVRALGWRHRALDPTE